MGGRRSRMRPRARIGSRVAPPAATVAAIVAARHERRTAWAIATRLQVPRSTVAAVLVRVGLNRLAHLTPRRPVIRYERTRPGELVHLDIKPLGADPPRRASHSSAIAGRSVEGAGCEYAHVAVDDYSRVAYVEVLPDQTRRAPPRPSSGAPSAGLPGAASPSHAS